MPFLPSLKSLGKLEVASLGYVNPQSTISPATSVRRVVLGGENALQSDSKSGSGSRGVFHGREEYPLPFLRSLNKLKMTSSGDVKPRSMLSPPRWARRAVLEVLNLPESGSESNNASQVVSPGWKEVSPSSPISPDRSVTRIIIRHSPGGIRSVQPYF